MEWVVRLRQRRAVAGPHLRGPSPATGGHSSQQPNLRVTTFRLKHHLLHRVSGGNNAGADLLPSFRERLRRLHQLLVQTPLTGLRVAIPPLAIVVLPFLGAVVLL